MIIFINVTFGLSGQPFDKFFSIAFMFNELLVSLYGAAAVYWVTGLKLLQRPLQLTLLPELQYPSCKPWLSHSIPLPSPWPLQGLPSSVRPP